MRITVPKGKKLLLTRKNQGSITPNVDLILDGDITLSLSSEFSPIYGGSNSTLSKVLTQVGMETRQLGLGFSTQLKQFGYQSWDKTDPLSLNLTVKLFMGSKGRYDAFTEVYQPSIALAKLPLPSSNDEGVLIAPGPPLSSLIQDEAEEASESILASDQDVFTYQPIKLSIANIISIPSIIVKKAEPTYSQEVDENGYPIWANVNLDIQSVNTATAEMLDG